MYTAMMFNVVSCYMLYSFKAITICLVQNVAYSGSDALYMKVELTMMLSVTSEWSSSVTN